ncbi:MAG: hypothetical protein U5P41_10480 [Gammaproteobacteria bacterium]|nr:hypothetical protein [Gammaproteobacteria bacterium]
MTRNPTEGNRVAAAKILRQYFAKNRHHMSATISSVAGRLSATSAHAAVSGELTAAG